MTLLRILILATLSWCLVLLSGLFVYEAWHLALPIRAALWWSFGTGEPPQ
jgi:hypothetical protein